MDKVKTAKARHGMSKIIVDDCPYCHKSHTHNYPIGEGQRLADCYQGEYILDFSPVVLTGDYSPAAKVID